MGTDSSDSPKTAVRAIPFGRPWITDDERRSVQKVLDGPVLTHGPECKGFEADFSSFVGHGAHSVTVSSCMAALHLAYFHLGIGAGDDVIVPAMTHTATAHAVEVVGARPIFVDCDPLTGNLKVDAIEAALTPKTKAISVVHFLGIPCEMEAIVALAEAKGLKIVEDCALAVGARYKGKHVGMFGEAGCYSFYPVKHLTTGEGGMFISRHASVAESVGRLRGFGVDRTHGERSIPGLYDVPELGLNYRMSEMQAALGRAQLRRVEENLARRKRNFGILREAFRPLKDVRVLDADRPGAQSSHYCLSLVLLGELAAHRRELVLGLKSLGIGTSVYYPHPVPRLLYYSNKYGYDPATFPSAAEISDQSVALPVGPHLESKDMDFIARSVVQAVKELRT